MIENTSNLAGDLRKHISDALKGTCRTWSREGLLFVREDGTTGMAPSPIEISGLLDDFTDAVLRVVHSGTEQQVNAAPPVDEASPACTEPDHACGTCGDCIYEHPGEGGCHTTARTVTVHACPPDGSGLMPCCGQTPFEAPGEERITSDPALVTCTTKTDTRHQEYAAAIANALVSVMSRADHRANGAHWAAQAAMRIADQEVENAAAYERCISADLRVESRSRGEKLKAEGERRQQAEEARDGAYRERAYLVALLAAMTPGAVIAPAPDVDDPGWQIVYLTIGGRQASWHISPFDGPLFDQVPHVSTDDPRAQWDGHTTEDKYAGIREHTRLLWRKCGPECSEGHTYTGRCEGATTQNGADA